MAHTVTDLSKRIEGLSPKKRTLLEQRLLQSRGTRAHDAIARRDRSVPTELSFSQQRLWFLDQWETSAPTYNAALALGVHGPLDVATLEQAIRTVLARHEALRTVFPVQGDRPVQVVLDDWHFEVASVDLSHLSPADRDREVARFLRESSRRRFDLSADLMLRVSLARLAPDDHVLLFEEHHIAFDGWSDAIMFRELAEAYVAHQAGRPPVLPELAIQYGDFAAWQRERLSGEVLAAHLEWWRAELLGAPALLRLPLDHPRPAIQTFAGAHQPLALPSAAAAGVALLSRSEGATAFMTVLAAFATFLYRWTGEDDLVIGTPIANRSRVELENLIGFFSNTLALRIRLHGNPSFREAVHRTRQAVLGAYGHQDLPFEKVVEAVAPTRDPSHNPLFQVNFRVQSGPPPVLDLPGTEVEPIEVDLGFSRFDLALEAQLGPARAGGYVEYNDRLFTPTTAAWIADAFADILEQALAHPDRPLLALELREREPVPVDGRTAGPIKHPRSLRNLVDG